MKKLNPKKVFIIADGSYREITPAEHEFRKEADAGYREKKFIGLHSMIMEVSEKEYIEFYRNKRRQKYLDEQRRDNGDVSYHPPHGSAGGRQAHRSVCLSPAL